MPTKPTPSSRRLGAEIKTCLRLSSQTQQKVLAAVAGVQPRTVGKWISGERHPQKEHIDHMITFFADQGVPQEDLTRLRTAWEEFVREKTGGGEDREANETVATAIVPTEPPNQEQDSEASGTPPDEEAKPGPSNGTPPPLSPQSPQPRKPRPQLPVRVMAVVAAVVIILILAVIVLQARPPKTQPTHTIATMTLASRATSHAPTATHTAAGVTAIPTRIPAPTPTPTIRVQPSVVATQGPNSTATGTVTYVGGFTTPDCNWVVHVDVQGFPPNAQLYIASSSTGRNCQTGAQTHTTSPRGIWCSNPSGSCEGVYSDPILGSHHYEITDNSGHVVYLDVNNG